ncbi:periplasmic heavy metal sensor [Brevundimonas sp. S30B]|uniref:periplasmic heavy metal sensor n=1 Tax=unclassified Brevundimonas TaxID=2622653 RepID=UPI0010725FDA|nr:MULTISPECIES: periplasmic heavy metal sensor [unclassified Brevundimonas]QBX37105.1 periplasmic heavy metal sensor [Brevundimonas sp. MF30-B]TFW04099.1 periplasmic heavy metal sensor [Brevundimonas sp. S30B]
MTPRALKIALIASIGLNLFALAVGLVIWIGAQRAESQAEAERRGGRQSPAMALIEQLEPAQQAPVRQALRASALAAKPDFEAARAARREAIARSAAPTFDQAGVQALLEESRLAEMRGRARLETGAVQVLSGLDQADRQALSPLLSRNRNGRRHSQPAPTADHSDPPNSQARP